MNAAVGGETQIILTSYTTMTPLLQAGRAAVAGGNRPKRLRTLPNTPTVVASGLPKLFLKSGTHFLPLSKCRVQLLTA